DEEVANVRFSIFDLDANQRINFTAYNDANVAQTITVVRASGSSGINITGSGSINVTATGPGTGYGTNSTQGTVNVTVGGPVSRIVLTLNNASGDFWLSDIQACATGTFPDNYQIVSRPFTGQRQYVLAVVNNNIYYIDPTNGDSYFLFNEPGHNRLNSMAYDPYNRIVYYTYSLGPNPRADKTLKKYDVDTKTISVVLNNVNSIGIPTYESGVESGAATFYNGSLYLGIEGYTNASYAAGRKSTIWKIDFDAAGNALSTATQVWGVTADNGSSSQNIHDWSDFGISNGVLYDFDGSGSGDYDYYQFNMMTGNTVNYIPVGPVPRQVSIGWDESLYNVDNDIAIYNGTNGNGTAYIMQAPIGPTIPTGSQASWGDAAGPYRPFLDFGDAPATYDPDPLSPACHDTLTPNRFGRRTKMILGDDEDVEWLKKGFTTVEDNHEDGLAFVPVFSPASGDYLAEVTVLNNTGQRATLCAWLDFNGNGYFDASESITPITVPHSNGPQSFWLHWPSTPSTLPDGSYTYLRIRITHEDFGMNQNNSTGYYDMGEVEDYLVFVDYFPLPVTLLSFDAGVVNDTKVKLLWSANEEPGLVGYDLERSKDGVNWQKIAFVSARVVSGINEYEYFDTDPFKGNSQYRLKMIEQGTAVKYSKVRTVRIAGGFASISLYPNPATDHAIIAFHETTTRQHATIRILNAAGSQMQVLNVELSEGENQVRIPVESSWPSGVYFVQVQSGGGVENLK